MASKSFFYPTIAKIALSAVILIIFPWHLFFNKIDWVFPVFLPLNLFISYFDACLFVYLTKLAKEHKKKNAEK